jgi:large repetitive protein
MLDICGLFQATVSLVRSGRLGFLLPTASRSTACWRTSAQKLSRRLVRAQAACFVVLMSMGFACSTATAQTVDVFPGSTAVGASSTAQLTVTVTMTANGAAVAPKALTQGIADGEFTITGGSCAAGSYMAGQQCTATVSFTPTFPGLRNGAVVVETSNNTLLGSALIAGLATGPLPLLTPGTINTVAGVFGSVFFAGDGVPAIGAPIQLPDGVVADAAGNFYLSDAGNFRIRKVTAGTGDISTIAGTGSPGYSGDGGPATQALISASAGLALDGAGNLYFADTDNHIIRRIDAFSGVITTVAGTPEAHGYAGDGGAATSALLTSPEGIAFDEAGDLFIADTGNNVIREVNAATGIISTVAGTGTAGFNGDGPTATTAQLNSPWSVSVAVAQDGSLYIADLGNNRVRKVNTSGAISTIAGDGTRAFTGDGGPAATAELNQPTAIAIDPAGNLYIADSENNRVREISASTGNIETICGTGIVASNQLDLGDDGPASMATINEPYALYFDQSGNLFIADRLDSLIRQINGLMVSLQYATIKVGNVSPPQVVDLANDGNADLLLTAPSLVMAAEAAPPTTTCTTGADIPSAGVCTIGAEFAPTVISDPVTADVLGSITVNAQGSTTAPVIKLSGVVLNVTPTTVALTSSMNPSLVGQSVTFTATVTNNGAALTGLTGTVTFLNGSTPLCSDVAISGGGVATCMTSTLPLGTSNITAAYSGDPNDEANTSNTVAQVVEQTPVLTLAVTPNPAVVTTTVTLTFTAAAPTGSTTGTPTGTVMFLDGTTPLSTALSLPASGVVTFSTTTLTLGTHNLSAAYSGVAPNASGTSNVVIETIQQATTATSLSSGSPTATVGSPVTFTATVADTDGGPAPTGSVTFNTTPASGPTPPVPVMLGTNGTAALPISSLAPGTYSITAVYSGDPDDAPSTSAPITETIQQAATTTTLTPSANPISAGATLTLTATVTGATAGAGALTETVTFTDQSTSTNYGPFTISNTGVVTFPINTLAAGTHNLVAAYSGNTNYAASTSSLLMEVVQPTTTMTTLAQAAPTTLAGEPASFTATVTSTTGGIPTGNVTFDEGGAGIGQATLNAQGVAVFSTTTLAVGTHAITAVYLGNGSYNTSTSSPVQHTVALATPTLTLAGPGTAVNAGTTFSMTATLNSNGVAPTGPLTLQNGATTLATLRVAANGTFTFTNISLGVGTYQLTAVYGGDGNNAAVTSAPVTVVVQLTPTTTSLISSINPATLGQSVTFTATASGGTPLPTGSIKFMDGAAVLGTSPVNAGGVATFATSTLTFGTHAITAVYQGDVDHAVSTSSVLNEQIVQAAAASLSSSLNPSIFGANVVFTVKVMGVGSLIPTGTVIFKDGAATLGMETLDGTGTGTLQTSSLAVGSHSISVSYSGDSDYSTASTSIIQTVQSATTQVTLAASANPATYATPVTFTATITDNGGIATGSVTFTDGGTPIGTGLLNANGVATLTSSTLAPGPHAIVANYAGNSNIGASSSTPVMLSVKEVTSVALASSANPAMTLSSVVLTATVSNEGVGEPTGTVTFTDGSTQLGTATLNANGVASLTVPSLAAGNHPLLASYAGDTDNFASTSATLTEGVQLRPTTTALTSSATDPNNPQQITLIASVGWTGPVAPTGTVTFTSGTTVLGSSPVDAIGIATLDVILSSPTENIVATYSGDVSYAGSSSLATSITGGIATQFTIQVTPSSVSIPTTDHATVGVTLTSLQGFSDTLQLGCLGLPYAATCTFSTPQTKLAANGAATVQLIIDTGNPLGAGATASLDRRSSSGVLLCLLPCLLGIGVGVRRRKFKLGSSLLLVCMVAMTLFAAGCSGLHVSGTPPGTYSFKVTASGVGSGATESQTVTLTVTK